MRPLLMPGSAKLGKTGTLSGERMLPFEEELNTVVDELSGTADAERALAALGEGRFGDAVLSGFLAIPIIGKAPKLVRWVVKGVDRAGKGLAGVVGKCVSGSVRLPLHGAPIGRPDFPAAPDGRLPDAARPRALCTTGRPTVR